MAVDRPCRMEGRRGNCGYGNEQVTERVNYDYLFSDTFPGKYGTEVEETASRVLVLLFIHAYLLTLYLAELSFHYARM